MSDEPTVIDPAAPVDPAAIAAPAVVDPPIPDPTPDPTPEPPKHGNAGKTPWYMTKIQQQEEAIAAAARRAADAEALARRLQEGRPADGTPPPSPAPATGDRQAEINAAAARQRFLEDVGEIRNRGASQFGAAFNETIATLNAAGAATDDFVADVIGVDKSNAHVLLQQLAENHERAFALAQMNPRQRIAELTRMADKINPPAQAAAAAPAAQAAPKTVSKAPTPPPALAPSTTKVVDWRDDSVSDADFSRAWEENMAKRSAGRR